MNIAIVYVGDVLQEDNKLCHDFLNFGCGGTETCVIQLAEQLVHSGNFVDVICVCDDHYEICNKLHYVTCKDIDHHLATNSYDLIIVECYYKNIMSLIEKHHSTDNVLLFHSLNGFNTHDCFDRRSGFGMSSYQNDRELQSPSVKKFIALSESQKQEYIQYNGIPEHMINIIPNGIDVSLFEGISMDHEIDHSILWSSSYFRGASFLIDVIAPVVRQTISDFSVEMCTPLYCKDAYTHQYAVKDLGHLSKTDLIAQMSRHACWWYPSTFNETFCITSVEAALAGNDLILPLKNGPATTFAPFKDIIGMKNTASYLNSEFTIESAERICNSIAHYHDSINVKNRIRIHDYIIEKCSWKNVADMFIGLVK